jgi:ERCC4-related helicase
MDFNFLNHKLNSIFYEEYKLNEQMKIIDLFKENKFRILISTSVSEEGIDIPSCNVVIAFD